MTTSTESLYSLYKQLLAQNRQIAIIWEVEEVLILRPDHSPDQAWWVLQQCERHHDASIGICWEVLECTAEIYFPLPDETLVDLEPPSD